MVPDPSSAEVYPPHPGTWQEFRSWLADERACATFLEKLRWPTGFRCPKCECVRLRRAYRNCSWNVFSQDRAARGTVVRLDFDPRLGRRWLKPRAAGAAQHRRAARACLLWLLCTHAQDHAENSRARGRTALGHRKRWYGLWNTFCTGLTGEDITNSWHASFTFVNNSFCFLLISYNCSIRVYP